MQPHSMCTVALANFVWNQHNHPIPELCTARVEYRDRYGKYKTNVYRLYNIIVHPDMTYIRVSILRDGGGLACTMHARRPSHSEGNRVTQEHDTQHIHGLREEYYLYKSSVKSGRHVNSGRYRNFEGDLRKEDRKKMSLYCEIKREDGSFFYSKYELQLESIKLVRGQDLKELEVPEEKVEQLHQKKPGMGSTDKKIA